MVDIMEKWMDMVFDTMCYGSGIAGIYVYIWLIFYVDLVFDTMCYGSGIAGIYVYIWFIFHVYWPQ